MTVSIADKDDITELCLLLFLLFGQEAEFLPNTDKQKAGLEMIIGNPDAGEILVLRDEGRVIGMVSLLYTVSTALGCRAALLEDMVIDHDYRGKGAGSVLLNQAIKHAESKGCGRITLLTDAVNDGAQRFYSRHGFTLSPMVPMRLML